MTGNELTPAPARRRPLERVALTLLAHGPPAGDAPVIGVTSVVDADDVNGRAVELSRQLALHSAAPTLLLEANLRVSSRLAAAMDMDPGPGLLDALRDPARADEAVRPTPDPRLWVMTAGGGVPSNAVVSLSVFAEVVGRVRQGSWATARRVLDVRDGEREPAVMREASPAMVGRGGTDLRAGATEPELRPFNEGPPSDIDLTGPAGLPPLPPLPPLPARPGADAATRPRRLPALVVAAPPLDEESDGDVIASQCDQVVLLVHLGRATREQVADAAARIGTDRLLGTVVVTPPAPRRRR